MSKRTIARSHGSSLAAAALFVFGASSCVTVHRWQKQQTQLHREIELADVAKSWCQTIRASQVIPVYPLTEDLQPGDVFLVETTVDAQAEEYKRKGYLGLDQHIARLDPDGYSDFYDHSVFVGADATTVPKLPAHWMRVTGANADAKAWDGAPRVAFPTYSFEVGSGAGANIAVPVQGVPVGLALLGTQKASGTISIKDSYTYGVDVASLSRQLTEWVAREDVRPFLTEHASSSDRPRYVRVITRVYLAGSVSVSLTASSSFGAGADIEAPRPVDLLFEAPKEQKKDAPGEGASAAPTSNTTADGADDGADGGADGGSTVGALSSNLESVNAMVAADPKAVGGSFRFTAAGGNSVSMNETFPNPLVVGYLAFDCEILPGGVLGAPIATRITLGDPQLARELFAENRVAFVHEDALLNDAVKMVRALVEDSRSSLTPALRRSAAAIVADLDALESMVDGEQVVYSMDPLTDTVQRERFEDSPSHAGSGGYSRFRRHRAALETSLDALGRLLTSREIQFVDRAASTDTDRHVPSAAELDRVREDEVEIRARLAEIDADVAEHHATQSLRSWLTLFWSVHPS